VRDWRREARDTALGGVLEGMFRFGWRREANGASVARLSRSPVEGVEYEERVLCPLVQHLSDHLE